MEKKNPPISNKRISMKQYVYLITILFLASCKTSIKKETKDTNSPAYKAFMAQKHRFELNGCELTYNGKPFRLGMSLKEFKKVFGVTEWVEEEDSKRNQIAPYFIYNKEKGIEVLVEDRKVKGVCIYMINNYLEYPNVYMKEKEAIVLNTFLLHKTDKMHEYVKRAGTSFDAMEITSSGYMLTYPCNNKELVYSLDSPVAYHRKGGGHLYIRGDWKLEDTHTIKSIYIYYKEEA
ncbi:Probable lipoprotein precursor [Tenacibaculum maritimum]|uniref:DUF7738 domain-containing protein n=1 Tax=Tenacibaculum maritimum TaxID=107401 RepID=UPI0012E60D76|nr:hypothetical protein [Tenacibaculum maritimum]CAA0146765.1 Probable lipoprotein precursor [Tenacibaculum maritimum]